MGKERFKKIFLEELPRKEGIGALKGKQVIDWKNSVGHKVRFVYDDVEGEVEIIDYKNNNQMLTIKYLSSTIFQIKTNSFQNCSLGKLLNKYTSKFIYEIGQQIKDEKRDLVITDREYRKFQYKPNKKGRISTQNVKWYKYKCNRCSWKEGWIIESNLNKGVGCASCSNQVVTPINCIWNTDRWMCDLGVSEEDAKSNVSGSINKIDVVCPDCERKKKVQIRDIFRYKSISCSCGDGFSYPEKFMTNTLNQLNINFETQYSPEWANTKKFDFYVPSLNMIIETHGGQHYEKSFSSIGGKTLEEEQENDRVKKELALANGISKYIIIDCRRSEITWIQNSILNSELANLFDLSKIDWLECEKFALKNVVKEVCEYWNNKEDWETIQTIADNNSWGVKSGVTIRRYVKIGERLGWVNYDASEERDKAYKKVKEILITRCSKQVEIFKDGISLGIFESVSELERQSEKRFGVKLTQGNISCVCRGERSHYKGYTFKYI